MYIVNNIYHLFANITPVQGNPVRPLLTQTPVSVYEAVHQIVHCPINSISEKLQNKVKHTLLMPEQNAYLEFQAFMNRAPSDKEVDCLQSILQQIVAEREIKHIALPSTFLPVFRIHSYATRLLGTKFETSALTTKQATQIAGAIENVVSDESLNKIRSICSIYKKSQETNLQHDLEFNFSEKEVYVIARRELSLLQKHGSSKYVIHAVAMSITNMNKPAERVAKAYLYDDVVNADLALAEQELNMLNKLREEKNYTGIIHLRHSCQFNGKPSFVFDLYQNDLYHLMREANDIPFGAKLIIAQDLLHGLMILHKKGIVHGDIKAQNCLYKFEDNYFYAVLTDLGFAFSPAKDKPTFIYAAGFYGSYMNTPPEILGERNFKGDYFKTDVFAQGIVLFELFFRQHVAWQGELSQLQKNFDLETWKYRNEDAAKQSIQTIRDSMKKIIEDNYNVLNQKEKNIGLTHGERYQYIICKMLRYDPAERISAEEAYKEMCELAELYIDASNSSEATQESSQTVK